jgi:acyl-CoA synthetase (AMP-forming)/AMP-acid ligase II
MPTISEVLIRAYQEIPDREAVHLLFSGQEDLAIHYRRLAQGSCGYAKEMERAGIAPGEVVILILNHGKDLIYAFFGAILQGAIPSIMPFLTEKLAPDQYRQSLGALFEITAPAAVVTYPEFEEEVRQAARGAPSVRAILTSDKIPDQEEIELGRMPGLGVSPEEIVLLQHSSGTTGLQKGVALSHHAIFNQLESYAKAIRLAPDDVVVSWLPLYHDMGLIAGFLLPILSRIPLVLLSPFDWVRAPYRLLQAIGRYRGTLCWLPNFAYNFCAQKIRDRDLQDVDLSSLRAVINCSEPMHWKSHQAFLERFQPYGLRPEALATCYAMAENVFAVTQGGIESPVNLDRVSQAALLERQIAEPARGDEGAVRVVSAGRPISNTRVRVLDPQGSELPERTIGEIALRSSCMLTGYYRRPDLTEKAFLNGWYLTGDLGYLAEGEVYITGRKKDLIIVGGKNVYPQDLERLAYEVPGVHPGRAVAFGVFNEAAGTEDVVLVAEVDEENEEKRQATAEAIRRQINRGSDIALRYVYIVGRNWLLKTSSGKIARLANKEKYLSENSDLT